MAILMWLTIQTLKIASDKVRYTKNNWWYIQTVTALVFTFFFRQNGLLPAIVIMLLLIVFVQIRQEDHYFSSISCGNNCCNKRDRYISIFYGYRSARDEISGDDINDIMYVYYNGYKVSDRTLELVNKVTGGEPEKYDYKNYELSGVRGYTVPQFLGIYIENCVRNPIPMTYEILSRGESLECTQLQSMRFRSV